ncbi:amidohydrolase family protein [Nocardia callitridis]|uniref:amidohydrolase family protein n=1 Tax=Nocardia callitridis TaxID=648753 RepID=UPI0031EDC967
MDVQVIDTHAHVYPAGYLDRLESVGIPAASTKVARNMQADDTARDMSARLAMMDAARVDIQVLSVSPQLPMVDDRAAAAQACRAVDIEYADIVGAHADRFYAYGAAPLPHAEDAAAEVGYCLDELGFVSDDHDHDHRRRHLSERSTPRSVLRRVGSARCGAVHPSDRLRGFEPDDQWAGSRVGGRCADRG